MKQQLLPRLLLFFIVFLGILPSLQAQRVPIAPTITFDRSWAFLNATRDTIEPQGPNRWIINNLFAGSGDSIPETPSQRLKGKDTIINPGGNYMHITYDSLRFRNPMLANSFYNPRMASENFTIIFFERFGQWLCTADYSDVALNFFYINPTDAELEIYYNVFDQTGPRGWKKIENHPNLSNQKEWTKVTITDTAFTGKRFIAFGFNWKNKTDDASKGYLGSVAIDDITIDGVMQDEPVQVQIDSDSAFVCIDDVSTFSINHNRPSCSNAYYRFFVSNNEGTFSPDESVRFLGSYGNENSLVNISNIKDFRLNVAMFKEADGAPPLVPSKCYRLLVQMVGVDENGQPFLISVDSTECFEVRDCGSYTRTQDPIVIQTRDSSICRLSTIDLPFTNNGTFEQGNEFVAELSDENGSFARPTVIGRLASIEIFRGTQYDGWGKVPIQIPADAKVGCGYKMRVTSTSPNQKGRSETRPFCIRACDIEANNATNLNELCITTTDTSLSIVRIPYRIHRWADTAVYSPTNRFQLFFYDRTNLRLMNFRPIQLVTEGDSAFRLDLNRWPQPYNIYGLIPGDYYAQIGAFDSTENGLVLRQTSNFFKFGFGVVPGDMRMEQLDSVVCKGGLGLFGFCLPGFDFSLINGAGEYRFFSPQLRLPPGGFVIPTNFLQFDEEKQCWGIFLNLGTIPETATLSFITYQLQYFSGRAGCQSVISNVDTIWVQSSASNPINLLEFSPTVCVQDTAVEFRALYRPGYNYQFVFTPAAEILEQNREGTGDRVKVKFPGPGKYRIRVIGTGECRQDISEEKEITVGDIDSVRVRTIPRFPNFTMCAQDTMPLTASGANRYTWAPLDGLSSGQGESVRANPTRTTTYTITGFVGNCTTTATVTVTVNSRPTLFSIDSLVRNGSTYAYINRPSVPTESLQWYRDGSILSGETRDTIRLTRNGLYSLEVTNQFGCVRRISKRILWTNRVDDFLSGLNLTVSPNPYRGQSNLTYTLTGNENINIDVYDMQGKLLKNIVSGKQNAGQYNHSIAMREWGFTAGSYLLKVQVGNAIGSLKLIEVE